MARGGGVILPRGTCGIWPITVSKTYRVKVPTSRNTLATEPSLYIATDVLVAWALLVRTMLSSGSVTTTHCVLHEESILSRINALRKSARSNCNTLPRQKSSPGTQGPPDRNVEQQTHLRQQRLNTFMAEPWASGNRLVALPYTSVATEASRQSQSPSLVRQSQDLMGVGSWTTSQGGK